MAKPISILVKQGFKKSNNICIFLPKENGHYRMFFWQKTKYPGH